MSEDGKKFNCYECEHRGPVPGDAHSRCHHPSIKGSETVILIALTCGNLVAPKELNIQGNRHGIEQGWFMWPFNYDPVWLENCDGFTVRVAV